MSLVQHGEADSLGPPLAGEGGDHLVHNAVEAQDPTTDRPPSDHDANGQRTDDVQGAPEQNGDADVYRELEVVRAEKAALEGQYRALLGKLTTMRNTLGDKLRQDAVRSAVSFAAVS